MNIVFTLYPDDEFMNGALHMAKLQAWADRKGVLLLPAPEPVKSAHAVGVQTYVQQVAKQAISHMSEKIALYAACDLLEANPDHPCHPTERLMVLNQRDAHVARRIPRAKHPSLLAYHFAELRDFIAPSTTSTKARASATPVRRPFNTCTARVRKGPVRMHGFATHGNKMHQGLGRCAC